MRCCQAERWSTSVLRSRTFTRSSRMCSGGIQDSGSRPSSSDAAAVHFVKAELCVPVAPG
jgi:hypothetical protein